MIPLPQSMLGMHCECYTAEDLRAYGEACAAEALAAAWIPCAERMPERGVEVLACVSRHSVYMAELDHDGFWRTDGDGGQLDGVTHWMPLPAPPKEPADPAAGG